MTYFDETGLNAINLFFFFFSPASEECDTVSTAVGKYTVLLVHLGIGPYLLQTDRICYVSSA